MPVLLYSGNRFFRATLKKYLDTQVQPDIVARAASDATFVLSGSAAGSVPVGGSSTAAFTLSGSGTGEYARFGESAAVFTMAASGEGSVA